MINPFSFISRLIKSNNQRQLDKLSIILNKVNSFENELKILKDEDFPKKTQEFKERIKKGESLDKILPEAFALKRGVKKKKKRETLRCPNNRWYCFTSIQNCRNENR